MKALVVYYSLGGNTRKIANLIQSKINADIAEIKLEQDYKGSYDEIVELGQEEVNSGYMPKIKQLTANLDDYDAIILGTTVWWYTFAPAMKSFLNTYNLANKNIYIFATNGGWIGHTFQDFKDALPKSNIISNLNIQFNDKDLAIPQETILNWIENIK